MFFKKKKVINNKYNEFIEETLYRFYSDNNNIIANVKLEIWSLDDINKIINNWVNEYYNELFISPNVEKEYINLFKENDSVTLKYKKRNEDETNENKAMFLFHVYNIIAINIEETYGLDLWSIENNIN